MPEGLSGRYTPKDGLSYTNHFLNVPPACTEKVNILRTSTKCPRQTVSIIYNTSIIMVEKYTKNQSHILNDNFKNKQFHKTDLELKIKQHVIFILLLFPCEVPSRLETYEIEHLFQIILHYHPKPHLNKKPSKVNRGQNTIRIWFSNPSQQQKCTRMHTHMYVFY